MRVLSNRQTPAHRHPAGLAAVTGGGVRLVCIAAQEEGRDGSPAAGPQYARCSLGGIGSSGRMSPNNAAKVRCLTFLSCNCACCALPIPGRSPNPSAKTPFIHLAALWLAMLSVHVNTFLFNRGHELTKRGSRREMPARQPVFERTPIREVASFIRSLPTLVLVRRLCVATISSRARRRNPRRRPIRRLQVRDQRRRVGTGPHGQRRRRV